MGLRVGLLFFTILSASWVCHARETIFDPSTRESVISNVAVLQINHQELERGVQDAKEVDMNDNACTLCEEYATMALAYLAENKTQTEVIDLLHVACSQLQFLKQECVTMVDYYAPLFFLEIDSVQPAEFCQKIKFCQQMVIISRALSEDSCGLCHRAVAVSLLKLKNPDTQLEIVELLLKACNTVVVENYVEKCKTSVFEYGPLILNNAEKFLETTDICTALHACDSPTAGNKQASSFAF
ncbi:uncharacterized protein LOC132313392 [Cornus florida]|uniref:uncharacterized protein LOC132313392 n=1 Tax=Cornus florida TaxID=4283 RepID=UPI0028967252|nr:uncharacterized protein LOC132313392 [Cornus florida]